MSLLNVQVVHSGAWGAASEPAAEGERLFDVLARRLVPDDGDQICSNGLH